MKLHRLDSLIIRIVMNNFSPQKWNMSTKPTYPLQNPLCFFLKKLQIKVILLIICLIQHFQNLIFTYNPQLHYFSPHKSALKEEKTGSRNSNNISISIHQTKPSRLRLKVLPPMNIMARRLNNLQEKCLQRSSFNNHRWRWWRRRSTGFEGVVRNRSLGLVLVHAASKGTRMWSGRAQAWTWFWFVCERMRVWHENSTSWSHRIIVRILWSSSLQRDLVIYIRKYHCHWLYLQIHPCENYFFKGKLVFILFYHILNFKIFYLQYKDI